MAAPDEVGPHVSLEVALPGEAHTALEPLLAARPSGGAIRARVRAKAPGGAGAVAEVAVEPAEDRRTLAVELDGQARREVPSHLTAGERADVTAPF